MSLIDGIRHRVYVLLRGENYAREVEREMRFHLELEQIANTDKGRADRDVELVARRNFGNVTYYREEVRHVTPLHWLDRIRQDASYAWRGLMRSPGFTATVVLTLGLGLGVNAAMYSFLDQILVRPPNGVVAPDGVRRLYLKSPRMTFGAFASFSYPRFKALRDRASHPDHLAAFTPSGGGRVTNAGVTDSARLSYVSPSYFTVLRLRPAMGRFFVPDEGNIETKTSVAVISDALWHRVFNGDPGVLGRVIGIGKKSFTVVGVAPPNFSGVDVNLVDVWMPLNCFPVPPSNGSVWYAGFGNYLRVIARIDDVAEETQLTSAGTTAMRTMLEDRSRDSTITLLAGPLVEARGPATQQAEVSLSTRLAGVALIVLLIACANIANMLLLRASSRHREIAVRRALGVSRSRLYGQLLTESVILALLSGAVALMFCLWGGTALRRLLMPNVHWATAAVSGRVVIATTVAAVAIGLVAGLFPAASAARVDLANALKSGGRSRHYRRARTQSGLLVTQAALSVVLLVAAGLFVRSLSNVRSIDLGYDLRQSLVVMSFVFREPERERMLGAELTAIADRLRTTPGVDAVGLSSSTPMGGLGYRRLFVPGNDSALTVSGEVPSYFQISPGFFSASGVRIVAGRDFRTDDRPGTAPVIIVGEAIAKALWPGETPIGKCLISDKPTNGCSTVVGVVADVHRGAIIERASAQYYLPLTQSPDRFPSSMVVRVASSQRTAVASTIRTALARVMPDQSAFAIRTMDQLLDRELRPWRMGAILFSALGLLALVVAAIGIYGVVAYNMSQRSHEMGVRIALGAQMKDVLDLVLGEGLRVVAIGLVIGVGASLLLGRLVSSLLFGVEANDPSVLIAAVVTMLAIAGVASLIPGWRAARVDPVNALRAD